MRGTQAHGKRCIRVNRFRSLHPQRICSLIDERDKGKEMTDIIDRVLKPRPPPETEWGPNVETSSLMRPTHKTPNRSHPTQPRSRTSTYREKAVRNRSRCDNRDRSAAVSHVLIPHPSEHSKPSLSFNLLFRRRAREARRSASNRLKAQLAAPRQIAIMVFVTECCAPLSHTKTGERVLVYKCRRVIGLLWVQKRFRIC